MQCPRYDRNRWILPPRSWVCENSVRNRNLAGGCDTLLSFEIEVHVSLNNLRVVAQNRRILSFFLSFWNATHFTPLVISGSTGNLHLVILTRAQNEREISISKRFPPPDFELLASVPFAPNHKQNPKVIYRYHTP